MAESFDPAETDALIARVDPDRHMASRFAPPEGRARLVGLYAFNYEIARVRERVTEPAIGDMRLAWWREAVDEIYDPKRSVRWHEAARALEESFAGRPPPRLWIDRLINARARDLDADPFASLDELRDYAEASSATLMRVAAWLLAPDAELSAEAEQAITHAGVAWALTGLIRAFPQQAAEGRQPLPQEVYALTGTDAGDVLQRRDPEAARKALEPVIALARQEQDFARKAYDALPAECAPAALYGALTAPYLERAARRRDPLREGGELSRLGRQARMVIAAARGRI